MPWQVLGLTISTRREKLVGTRRNIDCWNKEKYRLIKNRVFKRSKECSNAKCTTLGIIDSAHPNPRSYLAFRKFFVYHKFEVLKLEPNSMELLHCWSSKFQFHGVSTWDSLGTWEV